MEPKFEYDLKNAYRGSCIIGGAMIAAVFLYAGLIEFVFKKNEALSFKSSIDPLTLKYIFLAIIVVQLIAVNIIKNKILSVKLKEQQQIPINSPYPRAIGRLSVSTIIILAGCESIAIYGLVYYLLTRLDLASYMFMIASLLLLIINFPRYQTWRDWAQREERKISTNQ